MSINRYRQNSMKNKMKGGNVMNNNMLLRMEDLVNNPTPRVPVCLCLDVSGSMSGSAIDELNQGV